MSGSRKTSRLSLAFAAILPGRQRRWHAAAFVLLMLLCADTLFLLAHRGLGQIDGWIGWGRVVSRFYQATVLLHSALGYLLTLMLLGFLVFHVPAVLRQLRGRWFLALSGAVVAGSFSFLLYSGNYFLLHSKSTDNEWLYWGHMGLAGLSLIGYAGHRLFAAKRFPLHPVGSLLAAAIALAAFMIGGEVTERTISSQKIVATPPLPPFADATGFVPVSGINPAAPFFPSPVSMASGAASINTTALTGTFDQSMAAQVRNEVDRKGFASTRRIGAEDCARCHADTVAQWESSAHRFSSFNNPFYAAALEDLRASNGKANETVAKHLEAFGYGNVRTGQLKSQFCAGCHDPALLFEGRMRGEIDPGEIRAQAGLACLACHQIKDVPGHTGNGNYVWDDEFKDPYLFSASSGPIATLIHDLYLKANPEQHKRDMLKPVFSKGEFCGTCHKVAIETPVNEYHFVRGQDEYDAWDNSGVPLNAARTFYQPAEASTCQTCHMPEEPALLGDVAAKNGKVKSHRFVAVNTALPFVRGDADMITRTEAFLRDKKLRLSFAGLRAGANIALTTEEPRASLVMGPASLPKLTLWSETSALDTLFPAAQTIRIRAGSKSRCGTKAGCLYSAQAGSMTRAEWLKTPHIQRSIHRSLQQSNCPAQCSGYRGARLCGGDPARFVRCCPLPYTGRRDSARSWEGYDHREASLAQVQSRLLRFCPRKGAESVQEPRPGPAHHRDREGDCGDVDRSQRNQKHLHASTGR